jgi:Domain of unknown function (DUF4157)
MKTAIHRKANDSETGDRSSTHSTLDIQQETFGKTTAPDLQTQLDSAAQHGHSFSKIAIQPALVMGQPGDKYEEEADAMAAIAMRKPEPGADQAIAVQKTEAVQKQAAPEMAVPEMAELSTASTALESIPTAAANAGEGSPTSSLPTPTSLPAAAGSGLDAIATQTEQDSPEARIQQAMAAGGSSLPDETQGLLRSRLGMKNPEEIRIHTDGTASDLCNQLGALAFTTQNHIFFAAGQYNPNSPEGQELIFHEATHTMQQGAIESGAAEATASETEVSADVPTDAPTADTETGSIDHIAVQERNSDPTLQKAEEMSEEEKKKKQEESREEGKKDGDKAASKVDGESEEEKKAKAQDAAAANQLEEPKPEKPALPEKLNFTPPAAAPEAAQPDEAIDPEAIEQQAAEESAQIIEAAGWDSTKLPEWDQQVALQELFAGQDLMVQRDAATSPTVAPESGTVPAVKPKEKAFEKIEKPQWAELKGATSTEGEVGEWIANNMVLGSTTGKMVDIANAFGGLANETNPFGIMASMLDAFIAITELVTGILGIISLVLSLIAAVLYVVGAALTWLFGVGAALMAAASTIMGWVGTLGSITLYITIARLAMRGFSMVLRGLDIAWSAAAGASADELREKAGMIAGNAIGAVGDGFSILLATGPSAIGGSGAWGGAAAPAEQAIGPMTLGATLKEGLGNAGSNILGGVIGTVGGAPISATQTAAQDSAGENKNFGDAWTGKTVPAQAMSIQADEANEAEADSKAYDAEAASQALEAQLAAQQEQQQTAHADSVAALPPIPYDTPVTIQDTARNLAILNDQKQENRARKNIAQEQLAAKQTWAGDLAQAQQVAAQNQASLDQSNQLMDAQIQHANQFSEKSQDSSVEGKGLEGDLSSIAGSLAGQQDNIKKGAEKGEEEDAGSDPALKQGPEAGNKANQGPDTAKQASAVGIQGSSEAEKSAQESQKTKSETNVAKEKTAEFQTALSDRQGKNAEEVGAIAEWLQNNETERTEIETQEQEQHDLRIATLERTQNWIDESKTQVAAGLGTTLAPNQADSSTSQPEGLTEAESEAIAETAPTADAAPKAPEEKLAEFEALAAAIAASLAAEEAAIAA